jgi:uncharacterized membrane protein YphA (DoxX/SURF4 family)
MSTGWASGGPKFRGRAPAQDPAPLGPDRAAPLVPDRAAPLVPDRAARLVPDRAPAPQPAAQAERNAGQGPQGGLAVLAERAGAITAEWAPTTGRILLGLVFFWFGYHELVQPGGWTQYVPVVNESSSLAVILVLAHGWVLFVLAAALVAGIAPRVAAAIASVLLLEIVISLAVTGLSPEALRDVGVLGLAVCLTGCRNQRLVLRD